jgi:hypothetical protein
LYWESTGDFDEKVNKEKAQQLKGDWFRNVSEEFGDCGVIAYLDNESVGYAQYALQVFSESSAIRVWSAQRRFCISRMPLYSEERAERKGHRQVFA